MQWVATSNSLNEPDKTQFNFTQPERQPIQMYPIKFQSVLLKQFNSAAYEQNKHSCLFCISH